MKKFMKVALMAIVGLFVLVPMINVHAEDGVVEVRNADELYKALEGAETTSVKLMDNIQTTHKINVTSDKVIDGNGYTIEYVGTFKDGSTNNTVWGSAAEYPYNGGVYVIQAYTSNVTLKNITLTGGNVGLGVNGATVTLIGKIDVSGNGFGGIEMSKGANVTELPYVHAGEATITNTTETATTPTVWTDGLTLEELESGNADFEASEDTFAGAAYVISDGQLKFYMDETQMPEESDNIIVVPITPEETEEPEEEPTTQPTEQERVEDTTENPETSDGILLFVSLAVIGLAGTTLAYRRLHN